MKSIVEENSLYKGYKYMVMFLELGHRCGYVQVPDDHPINNDDCWVDPETDITCHGGITFCHRTTMPDNDAEAHLWIGFDCRHYGDAVDADAFEGYFGKSKAEFASYDMKGVVRTKDYVVSECERIIEQLVAIESCYIR